MHSPERADFEVIFKNKNARNAMIRKVAEDEARLNTTLYLRFCAAVDEYEDTTQSKERKQKARKIICMFIQNGSMFQLTYVPEEFVFLFIICSKTNVCLGFSSRF